MTPFIISRFVDTNLVVTVNPNGVFQWVKQGEFLHVYWCYLTHGAVYTSKRFPGKPQAGCKVVDVHFAIPGQMQATLGSAQLSLAQLGSAWLSSRGVAEDGLHSGSLKTLEAVRFVKVVAGKSCIWGDDDIKLPIQVRSGLVCGL